MPILLAYAHCLFSQLRVSLFGGFSQPICHQQHVSHDIQAPGGVFFDEDTGPDAPA
jgi:hypothetical protein